MSQLGQFTQYIGLVVVLSALVLLAPRLTVATWSACTRGVRDRWLRARGWRPGTEVAAPNDLPVDVRVGDPRPGDPDEVLEHHGLPHVVHALREVWAMAREALEAGAVALAVAGLTLRTTSAFVEQLPEPVVLASDLLLVLGTFLLMQRIIRDYPAHLLPSALAPYLLPARVRSTGRAAPALRGRSRRVFEMALLAPGFVAVVAWPVEIARFLAEKQFTGPRDTVMVVWACELPWLVAFAWFLARPLIPRRQTGRHAAKRRPVAPVVALRRNPALSEQEHQAA